VFGGYLIEERRDAGQIGGAFARPPAEALALGMEIAPKHGRQRDASDARGETCEDGKGIYDYVGFKLAEQIKVKIHIGPDKRLVGEGCRKKLFDVPCPG
jgi:hypothetical protein